MLDRLLAIATLAAIPIIAVLLYKIDFYVPDITDIEKDTGVTLPENSRLIAYELIHGGIDATYVATVSISQSGEKICDENQFERLMPELPPLSKGGPGYSQLWGKAGICYARKSSSDGDVFVVVRHSEIAFWVAYL